MRTMWKENQRVRQVQCSYSRSRALCVRMVLQENTEKQRYFEGAEMIPQDRLINYASNFLESEIENIENLLKDEAVNDVGKELLSKLLKEYKHDLEVIERERW